MKLRNQYTISAIILSTGLIVSSCGDSPQVDDAITESTVSETIISEDAEGSMSQVRDIFYAVPSPMEMGAILKRSGAEYDMGLLNDVKKANDFNTSKSQALNLGIYGADLSYASIFNQNQESIIYLSCTKKLADKLGVTKAFDDNMIERMEANVENRDSLLSIVSETYYVLDSYLKENDRGHISAMVIAAGWIEGLYLASYIADDSEEPNEQLIGRVAEQKLSLMNLKSLVTAYNTENQLDDILADIALIETAFAPVTLENEQSSVTTADDGVTEIGGATTTAISPETLKEIARVVSEIRTRYVS